MKPSVIIASIAIIALVSTAAVPATAQDAAANAQATLDAACATCHDLSSVQPGFYTMAEWRETIDRMLGYGASLTAEQTEQIVAYLGTDAPGASLEDAETGGSGPVDAEAAQALLNSACATCHDLSGVQPGLYTSAEWSETINRMLGYGAAVSEDEIDLLVRYLATDAAPGAGEAETAQLDTGAAQALLDSACTTCHDLSGVQQGLYTAGEWRDTINRMLGYGAAVSEDEIDLLVDYLATDAGGDAGETEVDSDAAQALLNSACATCHDLSGVEPGLYTAAEWTETINRMLGYGASLSDNDTNLLLDYLATDR